MDIFLALDDSDIWYSLKSWQNHGDFILQDLCKRILERKLFQIHVQDRPIDPTKLNDMLSLWSKELSSKEIAINYVFSGQVSNQTYSSKKHPLLLLSVNDEVLPIHQYPSFKALMKYTDSQTLYYLCYPKKNSFLEIPILHYEKFTAQQIASQLKGTIDGDPETEVSELSKIEEAQEGSLSFWPIPNTLNSYIKQMLQLL